MDLLELLKKRYSVRKFEDKKVEKEKLDLILEAARVAPTACNFQPQRILVLDNEESLEKLKKCTPYHFHAPLALVVCYDKTTSWKRKDGDDMGEVDAAIVTTQMMLETENIGLGTTWVGYFDKAELVKEFEIPENFVPVSILPIGYPKEGIEPNPLHYERKDLSETMFYNKF